MNSEFLKQNNKNPQLTEEELKLADPKAVIQLAKFLKVLPEIIKNEKLWFHNVIIAILREQKRILRLPNRGRKNE